MASMKDRLIQFIFRGKDDLSPVAQEAADALDGLKAKSEELGQALDNAKAAQGLANSLKQTQRAVEQAENSLVQGDLQIKELRAALDKAPGSEGLQQSLKDAEREARRATKQLSTLRGQLADTEQAARAAGVNTDNLGDEQKRLTSEVDKARAALNENNTALKAAQREQDKAARSAAEHATSQESLVEFMSSGAKKVGALVAAYLSLNAVTGLVRTGLNYLAQGIRAVATDGSERQQALAQLEAAIASTGSAAGLTARELLAMADALEANSMLTAEQVQAAQTRLLSYTDVAATEFPRAMQVIVDQQQRLGISVEQSAEIVGKALQSPSEAIATLGRQGFKLEDGQKRLLKQLEATGQTAKAQGIIMDMLSEAYGGAAASARMKTAAGLWKGLADRIGDFASRVADKGAFEYIQSKLLELSDYLEEMANDGRLDRLAQAISDAFIQGADRAEQFAKKLLDIDFNTLTDDASRWLDNFGDKLETAGRWVTMITAPVRALANVVTGGISAIGTAFTALVGTSLSGMALVARALPDAFGGQAVVKGLESARDKAFSMMKLLASQVAQDGRDLASTWNDVASAAETSAERQASAAKRMAEESRRSLQQTGADIASFFRSNITSLENALAAIKFSDTAADLEEVEKGLRNSQLAADDMAEAMAALEQRRAFVSVGEDVKRTTTEVERLRAEQTKLREEYFAGTKTLEEWQQGHNVAAAALRELEGEAGKATTTAQGLGRELENLTDVQRAISDAKTDRDIAAVNSALKRMLDTGIITGEQYNAEMQKSAARMKEIKRAIEGSKTAQDQKNKSDEEAIVTSEQLRRESGKRMEAERQAGDAAMQARRKGSEEAKRDMSAVEGFFGGVLTRAREPLAGLSKAALDAYDKLRGIKSADLELDTSSLEATARSLDKVNQQLDATKAAFSNPLTSGLGKWAASIQRTSLETQQAYLGQKAALQSLMERYESGGMTLAGFAHAAAGAKSRLGLLDDSDLSGLESAIKSAKEQMKQLGESTRGTLESLQDELDGLEGREADIQRRRFSARQRELQAQLAEAQASGDANAVSNAARALGVLRQIEAATEQARVRDQQQRRIEAEQKTAAEASQPITPAKVIRLEAKGQTVDVPLNDPADETKLLGILEAAGLRSI